MNTTPKPLDILKNNIIPILTLVAGLALGYGFGASRANVAVVYAPAQPAPNFASAVAGAPAPASMTASSNAQLATAVAFPASRQAVLSAAEAPARFAPTQPQAAPVPQRSAPSVALEKGGQNMDLAAHEKSSAFIANANGAGVKSAAPVAMAAPQSAPASANTAAPTIAQGGTIHYGAVTRNEIMGRGAGPVYNFSGGGSQSAATGAVGQAVGSTLNNATQALSNTQNTIDSNPAMTPELRQQIETQINASKASIQQVQAGQPGQ